MIMAIGQPYSCMSMIRGVESHLLALEIATLWLRLSSQGGSLPSLPTLGRLPLVGRAGIQPTAPPVHGASAKIG